MATGAKRVKELRHLAEHMRHGQNRNHGTTLGRRQKVHTCLHITRERARIQHHAFRATGTAGCVVDQA